MIISLQLNCRVLADSTLMCAVNFYQDGNDCKGFALINIKKKIECISWKLLYFVTKKTYPYHSFSKSSHGYLHSYVTL